MQMKWFAVLALLGIAAFVAGCGGGGGDREYVDPYKEAVGGGSSPAPMPAESGASEPKGERTGDATGDGNYGERKYSGFGQADLGSGEMGESEYREAVDACKASANARKLYMDYMAKKRDSGAQDMGLLNSALSILEQTLPKLDALIEKYPDNVMIQEAQKNAAEDHRALMYEK